MVDARHHRPTAHPCVTRGVRLRPARRIIAPGPRPRGLPTMPHSPSGQGSGHDVRGEAGSEAHSRRRFHARRSGASYRARRRPYARSTHQFAGSDHVMLGGVRARTRSVTGHSTPMWSCTRLSTRSSARWPKATSACISAQRSAMARRQPDRFAFAASAKARGAFAHRHHRVERRASGRTAAPCAPRDIAGDCAGRGSEATTSEAGFTGRSEGMQHSRTRQSVALRRIGQTTKCRIRTASRRTLRLLCRDRKLTVSGCGILHRRPPGSHADRSPGLDVFDRGL